MAHTITGIDLGSWAVKFTVLDVGFRHTRVVSTFEERVAADERPLAERQYQALRQGAARLPGGTTAYLALSGEMLTLRVLDLPFADARKIDQVVGYEMEGQIIHELNDVILDHVVLSARGQVDEGTVGCRALVVAARVEEVRGFLDALKACDVDARSLFVAPLLYRPQTPAVMVDKVEGVPAGCRVVADIGHRRTNLCFVVGDEAVFARTLLDGGEAITKALMRASKGTWTWEQAEQGKAQLGFVASSGRPAASNVEINVDTIVREALQPLLRDVRQTLTSFATKDKAPVEEILLTGGGARLTGLAGFLEDELCLPVRPLRAPPEMKEGPDGLPIEVELDAPEADRFVLASAIADTGARGQKQLDLRRGEFQYKANFSIVRQRASHLMVLAASLIACVGIHATITLRRLSAEQRVLKTQLQSATKELFGETRMEATDVTAALKRSFRDEMAPLPKATAFDLLDDISNHIPPADKVQVDIEELDIKAKKTTMKGTIDSAAAVDEMVAKLKGVECFEEISKGPISEVSGGAKQFSLAIASKCP
jgi:type IV pilus assembly protein PilM